MAENPELSVSRLVPRLGVAPEVLSTSVGEAEPTAISPCSMACPLGINVQRYVGLAQRGLLIEALESILEACPLPGVCGYLCQRPCESSCRRGAIDRAVAIRWIKRAAAGAAVAAGIGPDPFVARMGRGPSPSSPVVAVVGAGPAGLSAAWALVRRGRRVVLLERRARAGGLLDEVVPDFRLPRRVLAADVDRLLAHPGITVRWGVDVGKGGDALREVDEVCGEDQPVAAVLLSTGAGVEEAPRSESADLAGIVGIEGVTTALAVLRGEGAVGDRAVVAGATTPSVVVARELKLRGWREVSLVSGRPRELWPADLEEIEAAEAEGVLLRAGLGVENVEASGGRLEAVIARPARVDGSGRVRCGDGERERLGAELFVAEAQRRAEVVTLGRRGGVGLTSRGAVRVDPCSLRTDRPGLFAAGECVTGPKTVVEAMAAGKRAAEAIDRYLDDRPVEVPFASRRRSWFELAVIGGVAPDGTKSPVRTGQPIAIPASVVSAEARRCLRCGPCVECDRCDPACRHERAVWARPGDALAPGPPVVYRAPAGAADDEAVLCARVEDLLCTGCGRCETACPHHAVVVRFGAGRPPRAVVTRPACRGCGRCAPACPFGAIDLGLGRGEAGALRHAIGREGSGR